MSDGFYYISHNNLFSLTAFVHIYLSVSNPSYQYNYYLDLFNPVVIEKISDESKVCLD